MELEDHPNDTSGMIDNDPAAAEAELAELRRQLKHAKMALSAKQKRQEKEKREIAAAMSPAVGSKSARAARPPMDPEKMLEKQEKSLRILERQLAVSKAKEIALTKERDEMDDAERQEAMSHRAKELEGRVKSKKLAVRLLDNEIKAVEKATQIHEIHELEELAVQHKRVQEEFHSARHKEQNIKAQTWAIAARNEYIRAILSMLMDSAGDTLRKFMPNVSSGTVEEFMEEIERLLGSPAPMSHHEVDEEGNITQRYGDVCGLADEFVDLLRGMMKGLHDAEKEQTELRERNDALVELYEQLVSSITKLDEAQTKKHGRDWAMLDRFREEQDAMDTRFTAIRMYAEEYTKLSEQVMFTRETLGLKPDMSPKKTDDVSSSSLPDRYARRRGYSPSRVDRHGSTQHSQLSPMVTETDYSKM